MNRLLWWICFSILTLGCGTTAEPPPGIAPTPDPYVAPPEEPLSDSDILRGAINDLEMICNTHRPIDQAPCPGIDPARTGGQTDEVVVQYLREVVRDLRAAVCEPRKNRAKCLSELTIWRDL